MFFQTRSLLSHELENFCAAYTRASGTKLGAQQISNCRVFGFFNREQLIGGFVLRSKGQFRALSAIVNEGDRQRVSAKLNECIEVTGLWFAIKDKSALTRLRVIASVMREVRDMGSRRMLGITTKLPLWEQSYRPLGAVIVYQGETELEVKRPREGIIFTMSASRLTLRIPLYLYYHLKKNINAIEKIVPQTAHTTRRESL